VLLCLLGADGRGAQAAPLLESRVGGLALVGPALDHPASVFYNPSALSLLPGTHLYLDGTFRLGWGSVALQPTDPSTGAPLLGPRQPAQDLREMFPHLFVQASSDLGFDSVVVGLTVHTPYSSRFSYRVGDSTDIFDPAAQGPARYHAVDLTMYSLFVTPSASFRIIDQLSIGFSFSYAFVATDFGFARDAAPEGGLFRDAGEAVALDDCGKGAPCGYGSNAAAEAVRIRGQANALAFSVGVLVRPHPRLDIGAAYHSRVVGWGESNIPSRGDAWVRRSQASVDNAAQMGLTGEPKRDLTGRGTITYSLPDMVNLGASWRFTPRLLLDLQLRWINFSAHDVLDVRLTGTEFRDQPQIPDRLVHFRGFQDVFAVQLGAGYQLTPRLLLQGASMVETAAVPAPAVSPAAVDNVKVDSFVAARVLLGRGFSLHAGYGLVVMPPREIQSSLFSPGDVVSCVEARYNIDLPDCRRVAGGQGLPPTAGRYALAVHRFGLGLAYDLW
jgi:hypothetical protein